MEALNNRSKKQSARKSATEGNQAPLRSKSVKSGKSTKSTKPKSNKADTAATVNEDYNALIEHLVKVQSKETDLIKDLVAKCDANGIPLPKL